LRWQTNISIDIYADPEIIWALLTEVKEYPRWNSTIKSIEGNIEKGGKIKVRSSLDQNRDPQPTYTFDIYEFNAPFKMVWSQWMGKRTYCLIQKTPDIITFTMTEKVSGLLVPFFLTSLPIFESEFEQFAADLKREAEKQMSTH
jgi:hypothetical protein